MATKRIKYGGKHRGDLWTAADANEVKDVVNANEAELQSVAASVDALAAGQEALSQAVASSRQGVVVFGGDWKSEYVLQPNTLYRWPSGFSELNISLEGGGGDELAEYMLEFVAGGEMSVRFVDGDVRWAEGDEPEWEEGWTYQVSIVNGLALSAGWEAWSR